jgi:hypothetical protein
MEDDRDSRQAGDETRLEEMKWSLRRRKWRKQDDKIKRGR